MGHTADRRLVTLCLDLLPSTLADEELRRLLRDVPGVLDARIMRTAEGRSLGFAIVYMATCAHAERMIEAWDGADLHGSSIRVSRLGLPTWRQAS